MPELGPFGETLLEANDRTMVAASFVNSPFAGCVESVVTFATQRFGDFFFGRGVQNSLNAAAKWMLRDAKAARIGASNFDPRCFAFRRAW
jgi:hypothetical protein